MKNKLETTQVLSAAMEGFVVHAEKHGCRIGGLAMLVEVNGTTVSVGRTFGEVDLLEAAPSFAAMARAAFGDQSLDVMESALRILKSSAAMKKLDQAIVKSAT